MFFFRGSIQAILSNCFLPLPNSFPICTWETKTIPFSNLASIGVWPSTLGRFRWWAAFYGWIRGSRWFCFKWRVWGVIVFHCFTHDGWGKNDARYYPRGDGRAGLPCSQGSRACHDLLYSLLRLFGISISIWSVSAQKHFRLTLL